MTVTLTHDTAAPDIETASEAYRRRFTSPIGRYFLETQAAAVRRLMGGPDGTALGVLEVGGGHGQLTPHLLAWGHDVWVHGSAPACARQIEPLLGCYRQRLHFVTSELWSLPFSDGAFDTVIALRITAHVERWRALLAELARVSRRQVLIDYASLVGWNVLTPLLFRAKRRIEGNTRPYFCYTGRQLRRAFRELGFSRIKLHKQFFLPMGLHRLIGRPGFSRSVERACGWLGLTRLFGSPVLVRARRGEAEARRQDLSGAAEGLR